MQCSSDEKWSSSLINVIYFINFSVSNQTDAHQTQMKAIVVSLQTAFKTLLNLQLSFDGFEHAPSKRDEH